MLNRATIPALKVTGFLGASRFFLGLFLVCFPFQVRSMVYGGDFFATGNFNPYATFFLHLTDIFLIAAFVFRGAAIWADETGDNRQADGSRNKLTILLMLILLAAICTAFFAGNGMLSFYLSLRLLLFFVLYLMISDGVMGRDEVLKCFLAGLVLQAVIASLQYFFQHSAGLVFLGESQISPVALGVAKIDFGGEKLMRAYGTFPHANVLGGALFMGLLFSFYVTRGKARIALPLLALFLAALIFSFSRSAFFALTAAFLVYISINEGKLALRYVLLAFSLLLFFIVALNMEGLFFQRFIFGDPESGQARVQYMGISKNMFLDNPMGVGVGGFTLEMQKYTPEKLEPWVYQPVHNVFLLAANELGVTGGALYLALPLLVFYLLVRKVMREGIGEREKQFGHVLIAVLAGIVTAGMFDHYFFTLYSGQALLFMYLGLAGAYLKKSGLPRRKS